MSLLFLFQGIIGLAIGFWATDKKRGISFKEVRFGATVMMIVATILLLTKGAMELKSVVFMIISGFILFGGIMVGENIHIRLVDVVLKAIEKEQIHATVKRFVETAKRAASTEGSGKEFMDSELYKTVSYLNGLSERARRLKQKELACQIGELSESCVRLSRLSTQIKNGDDTSYEKYERAANQLLTVSYEALYHTEKNIEKDLAKSWNTIRFAMKTVQMK